MPRAIKANNFSIGPIVAPKRIPLSYPLGQYYEPCICGGKRKMRECCAVGGHYNPKIPTITPPGPVTGYSDPECYLSHTANCCSKLTGEHWISKSVRDMLGDQNEFEGLSWLPRGQTKVIANGSAVCKMLCKRHNEALSPTDQAALRFFTILRKIDEDLSRPAHSRKHEFLSVSGELLELWALKTLIGMCTGGILRWQEESVRRAGVLPADEYARLLAGERLDRPLGLWVKVDNRRIEHTSDNTRVVLVTNKAMTHVSGLSVTYCGIEFLFLFCRDRMNINSIELEYSYRPSQLQFVHERPYDERFSCILPLVASVLVVEIC